MSLLDELSAAKGVKWDDLGQGSIVTGTVLSAAQRQANEFRTEAQRLANLPAKPAFWDDGKPKMQLTITLATALRNPEDPQDDGARSVSISLWSGQKRALIDAMRAAGAKDINPGDEFSAVWLSGSGVTGDPRVFAYKLTPGGGGKLAATLGLDKPQSDPWAAHQAAPATPAPAPVAAAPAPAPAAASPVENARQLLAAGLGVNDVAAATGLSAQIVAALAGTVQSAGPAPF